MTSTGCACGDTVYCSLLEIGYPWCRPCGEHHRAPECPIDEQGRALAPCGCPWEATEQHDHWETVHADPEPIRTDLAAALGIPAAVLTALHGAHWTCVAGTCTHLKSSSGGVGAAHTPTPPEFSTPVDPVNEGDA